MLPTLTLVFALLGHSLAKPLPFGNALVPSPVQPHIYGRQVQVTTILDPSCGTTMLAATAITFMNGDDPVTTVAWDDALVCTCGELTMEFSTSIDKRGVNSVFCASDGRTIAAGTAEPTGTPGDAMNPAWQRVPCDYGDLIDDEADPQKRWNDAGATAAWMSVMKNWELEGKPATEENPFCNWVASFFDVHDDPNCHILDNANCETTIGCGSAFAGGNQGDTNSPAGMVIHNSMVGIHTIFEDTFSAYKDALVSGLSMVGKLVSDFSTIEDDIKAQQQEKIMLDAVLGAIVFTIAPMLHFGLGKRVPWFSNGDNPNAFGSIVDSVYGALGAIMAGYKDAMESLSPLPIQNDVMENANMITDRWKEAVVKQNTEMFSNPELLGSFIHDGQFLDPANSPDPTDAKNAALKGLIASLLPAVWLASKSPKWPAIMVQDGLELGATCEETDIASFGEGEEGENWWVIKYEDDVNKNGKVCGPDGNAYWFVGVDPETVPLYIDDMITVHLGTPGDITALDGKTENYGGLNKVEMLMNAVNMYKATGSTNDWKVPDPTDTKFIETLKDGDLTKSWGLVKLPVCTMKEMTDTVRADVENELGNANYPCPGPPGQVTPPEKREFVA